MLRFIEDLRGFKVIDVYIEHNVDIAEVTNEEVEEVNVEVDFDVDVNDVEVGVNLEVEVNTEADISWNFRCQVGLNERRRENIFEDTLDFNIKTLSEKASRSDPCVKGN